MAADPLLKDLARKRELFPPLLDDKSRLWFTAKILAYVRAEVPAGDVATTAASLLGKACSFAKSRLDRQRGNLDEDLRRLATNSRRTRISYGLVGCHPSVFVDLVGSKLQNENLLGFLLERRFRTIKLVGEDMKPNGSSFRFASLQDAQPNADALQLWSGVTDGRYPYVLSVAGRAKPVDAVTKLFAPQADASDQSAFDCAGGAMAALLGALLSAEAPATFLGALTAPTSYLALDYPNGAVRVPPGSTTFIGGQGPILDEAAAAGANVTVRSLNASFLPSPLRLVNADGSETLLPPRLVDADGSESVEVTVERTAGGDTTGRLIFATLSRTFARGARVVPGAVPDYHITTDQRRDRALFEQRIVSVADLQLGDHVYFANHPLHRTWLSKVSAMIGEHAFKVGAALGEASGGDFTGHGLPNVGTRSELTESLLGETNFLIEYACAMVAEHLRHIASGATPDFSNIPLPTTLQERFEMSEGNTFEGTCDAFNLPSFEFTPSVTQTPLTVIGLKAVTMNGQLGGTLVTREDFIAFDYRGAGGKTVLLLKRLPQAGPPNAKTYGLFFRDDIAGKKGFFPLFVQSGPRKGKPAVLTYADVERPIAGRTRDEVLVLRPRAATDPAFIAFLTGSGAMPG